MKQFLLSDETECAVKAGSLNHSEKWCLKILHRLITSLTLLGFHIINKSSRISFKIDVQEIIHLIFD